MSDTQHVLFVHAHPDDEAIDTGGTIATLVDRGASVTVLTCTRGEQGEVIPADLQGALASTAKLAALRNQELVAAMKALGVTDHRYLGDENARWSGRETRRYADSGMKWGASGAEASESNDSESLGAAAFADVAADIAAVIIDVHPDVVVSYDADGGYGHPDHVRVHDAALRAAEVYAVPFYEIDPGGELAVDVSAVLERKRAALAAYRSQLTLDGDEIVLSGGQRVPVRSVERYSRAVDKSAEPIPFAEQHPAARFIAAVLGGVIGIALGALLTVYNQFTLNVAGQPIWLGAIAGIVVGAAVLIGFRLAFATRVVPAFAALGMIAIVAVLSFPSAGGSQLVNQNGPGILWEISPAVLAIVVLAWPQARRPRPGKIASQSVPSQRKDLEAK
jgi:N-acetyl-1-D-myo-inositol-2-amino-2-deoxy-alpha-D-glucopyranoside deacetylase